MLQTAATGKKLENRVTAIRVLGLIPSNTRARTMAEQALEDEKPEVRSAAASALGQMKAKASIPKLRRSLNDKEPSVMLASAHALQDMHDDSAYEVYFEVLTGERKASKGAIESQAAVLHDPKQLAKLGFEEGIGFIPFAGMGWEAIRRLTKDDTNPVRAAAARVLANDPDPDTGKALGHAANEDKNWIVRGAALEALAQRGDPSLLESAEFALSDEKEAVKYTAAAAVIHLMDVRDTAKRRTKKARPK
jgi:HEAT repeat protein